MVANLNAKVIYHTILTLQNVGIAANYRGIFKILPRLVDIIKLIWIKFIHFLVSETISQLEDFYPQML